MTRTIVVLAVLLLSGCMFSPRMLAADPPAENPAENPMEKNVTQGALRIKTEGGIVECPLTHTDVKADISGFIARVKVTQTFRNPLDEKIEAVYVFPLPHKSAVDEMTMIIGNKRIVGIIKRRAEAREIYEQALMQGLTAALLEQERPNIFTQSVGNIEPKGEVRIEISYVDVLEYDMGVYRFHFPMVVGPRFMPGAPTSKVPDMPEELKGKVGELDKTLVKEREKKPKGTGWSPDTDRVPDASRISPPVLKPGFRNGHDISLSVRLEAGVPIQDIESVNHKAEIERIGKGGAVAALSPDDSVPNKDFVLKYGVMGKKPEMAVLCHSPEGGEGYLMLMVQPREDERLKKTPPREITFLIDVSGSMRGAPTEKVKQAMKGMLKLCNEKDTLQVITFAGSTNKLFEKPVPASSENINKALTFTGKIRGGGGTQMLKGIKAAINDPLDEERVRIVMMLTDGFIGNEAEIIAEVGRHCGDRIRFWCIGMGTSVNRFLVDGVARQGGGMGKILSLNEDAGPLVKEVMFRIHRAQLAKVNIDWGKLPVWDTYPTTIPELWAGRPVIVYGRYEASEGGEYTITVSGNAEGEPVSWPVTIVVPSEEEEHAVLSKVWARNSIEDLMQQTYYAGSPEVEEEVTRIALEYKLMSQYTSFVAVDQSEAAKTAVKARPPRRMLVPVPLPEGTSYEGFFGAERGGEAKMDVLCCLAAPEPTGRAGSYGGGGGRINSMAKSSVPARASAALEFRRGMQKRDIGGFLYSRGRQGGLDSAIGAGGGGARFRLVRDYVELKEVDKKLSGSWSQSAKVLEEHAQDVRNSAKKAFDRAKELEMEGKLLDARAMYAWAYMLDTAYGNLHYRMSVLASFPLEALERLDGVLLDSWKKEIPRLAETLDIVIRDKSVLEVLDAVVKATRLSLTVTPGSLQDACAVTASPEMRVSYLDLRGATAAQALDWILRPARMTWRVENGAVTVETVRRGALESGWVYDATAVALPLPEEMEGMVDNARRIETAKKCAGDFMGGVRVSLSLSKEKAVWFAPGQILILADAKTHESARKLLADLADPKASLPGDLAALHKKTVERAKQRKNMVAKIAEVKAKSEIMETMSEHGLRLVSAAAGGTLDLEALTELQIAWSRPETADMLKKPGNNIMMRTLWAMVESAGALPGEKELAELAKKAQTAARESAGKTIEVLGERPSDEQQSAAVYAALAYPADRDFTAKVHKAVVIEYGGRGMTGAVGAAAVLLAADKQAGFDTLADALAGAQSIVRGQDKVLLIALACRKAGGEIWKRFRMEAGNILGNQILPGSVVVLVNRLGRTPLPTL